MRERILQGRPFSPEEIAQDSRILHERHHRDCRRCWRSCCEDAASRHLDTLLHWGEFAAVSAAMEHRGVPIDMEICQSAARQGAWAYRPRRHRARDQRAIRRLCPGQSRRVAFQQSACFEALLRSRWHRVAATEGRQARPARKTFDSMAKAFPQTRGSAPAAAHPRQDATGQAGGRRRRA